MNNNQHIPQGYKSSPLGIIPEDWEVKRLGEICTHFKSGNTITSKEIFDKGLYPVYGGNGFRGYSNTYTHDGNFILIGRQGALCGNINYVEGKNYISEHAIAVQTNENMQWLKYKLINWNLNRFSESSAQPGLSVEKLVRYKLVIPTSSEQNKIAEILQLWDTAISKQTQLVEKLTLRKRGLMQQLLTGKKRLKGFEGEWKTIELGDVLSYIQPTKYLVVSENYNDTYNTPVLTAGKTFILGYTNETTGVFDDLPAIIFDDFTTESKYVTFPFKAKSSAMKILKAHNSNLYFIFCAMQMIKYSIGGHERHWISKYSHLTLKVPSIEEQNAIASVLIQADQEIEIQKQKLARLQEQKKGLMQVLLTGKKRIK